jgi:hypothetical protein
VNAAPENRHTFLLLFRISIDTGCIGIVDVVRNDAQVTGMRWWEIETRSARQHKSAFAMRGDHRLSKKSTG